jgi:predicted dehydrogenase
VVGCGGDADNGHIPAVAGAAGVEIAGFADPNTERREAQQRAGLYDLLAIWRHGGRSSGFQKFNTAHARLSAYAVTLPSIAISNETEA